MRLNSPGDTDLHTDRTVRQLLFADRMPLLTGFELGFLDRVCLKEPIELRLVAPAPTKIVVLKFPGFGLADDGISPAG